jgi:hypothetical protein
MEANNTVKYNWDTPCSNRIMCAAGFILCTGS